MKYDNKACIFHRYNKDMVLINMLDTRQEARRWQEAGQEARDMRRKTGGTR
jgi:hypothetical protein